MKNESKLFNEAKKCLDAKSYQEAIDLFWKDLIQNPGNPISYHNIGLAQTYMGVSQKNKSLLESAIQCFVKAIAFYELNPRDKYHTAHKNLKWARKELNKLV